jgi:hypothetical protein
MIDSSQQLKKKTHTHTEGEREKLIKKANQLQW